MSRLPDYLCWDSPNFVFAWPKRLAACADAWQKLHIQAVMFGYLLGVGAAKGWDYTDKHCHLACLAAWVSVLVPFVLQSTAKFWGCQKAIKMLQEEFERELPHLTPEQADEYSKSMNERLWRLRKGLY